MIFFCVKNSRLLFRSASFGTEHEKLLCFNLAKVTSYIYKEMENKLTTLIYEHLLAP